MMYHDQRVPDTLCLILKNLNKYSVTLASAVTQPGLEKTISRTWKSCVVGPAAAPSQDSHQL